MKYIYDIPVYRLTEERYNLERNKYIKKVLLSDSLALREKKAIASNCNIAFRNHLQDSYGGCWLFNEIIGFIRLHFAGSQVRGEYFAVSKKRIVRTRKKHLKFITWKLAPEIDIPLPFTNDRIYDAILKYLVMCRKELPKRFIDTELFEVLGKHVDWCGLLATK